MGNWWDYGLKSSNGTNMPASGGVITSTTGGGYSFIHLQNARGAGSFSLEDRLSGTYHRTISTLPSGVQIVLEIQVLPSPGTFAYFPTETVTAYQHKTRLGIYKNGTSAYFGSGTGTGCSVIGGSMNIYNFYYRTMSPTGLFLSNGEIIDIGAAYPAAKSGGGATNQLALISRSGGIDVYITGFPCVFGGITVNTPCALIGTIPESALNNPFWFDPDSDGLTEEEQCANDGVGGNKPVVSNPGGDDIDFSALPSGASALGFSCMNLFNPTAAQLGAALDILFSDTTESTLETIIESCKKWWYKPEQYCVSLMLTPVSPGGTNSKRIYFGKYDTGVDAVYLPSEYKSVSCGSINVNLRRGNSFDFPPYVKAMIFLPFIGFRQINVQEIMGGTVAVNYNVNLVTGAALCEVKISNAGSNTSVLYAYECNVNTQIPITSENYNQVINSIITASTALVSSGIGGAIAMNAGKATGAAVAGSMISPAVGGVTGAVSNMGSPDIQISGQFNGSTAILGGMKPYIVIHYPELAQPNGYGDTVGYPSHMYRSLGSLNGYCEVEKIHLNIPNIYKDEEDELYSILYGGFTI